MPEQEQYLLGIVGWPLEHSMSPVLHNAALRHCGLHGNYQLFPIQPLPDGENDLRILLTHLSQGEIHGLNVTLPHKQAIIPLLDEVSSTAKAIGAVNTISSKEGKLYGENTDAAGFYIDLVHWLKENSIDISQLIPKALVLGAGGSARAVCYALTQHGWQVTLAARSIKKVQKLVNEFPSITAIHLHTNMLEEQAPSLIVNTTPVGMFPNVDHSPWPADLPLPNQAIIYDLVYNPVVTLFIERAYQAGNLATTGTGMLIEQAALSFETWTGQKNISPVMRYAFDQACI